jgi:AcrR family transcriptional regulator
MIVHLLSRGIVNGRSFIYNRCMPRPRTASDEAILEAANQVIGRIGPARLTLADVAAAAGLSPATLVQRFGSKRGLLLALCKSSAASVDGCFAAIRAEHASPLAALIAAATHMARYVTCAEELANGLAFLQMDLSDPEFHAISRDNSERLLAGYRRIIEEAVAAGELRPCEPEKLARAVAAITGGSLIAWAIHREGRAENWVRSDLACLLEPYRPKAKSPVRWSRSGRASAPSRRRKPRSN